MLQNQQEALFKCLTGLHREVSDSVGLGGAACKVYISHLFPGDAAAAAAAGRGPHFEMHPSRQVKTLIAFPSLRAPATSFPHLCLT